MRAKLFKFIVALNIICVGLMGCSSSNKQKVAFEVIGTEKTLPANFYDVANQGVVVKVVYDSEAFKEQWSHFGLQENVPDYQWDNTVVIFLGLIESGSCPIGINAVKVSSEESELIVQLDLDSERPCTDDATPRSIIFTLDARELSEVTKIKLENYNGLNPVLELSEK
ncbi:hypothetical protein [Bacillus sp. B15-48]|uniref:hypothetical protein n=1 Tax=Bacillus sp. B15-48 TaxID=1548601 RepID=UPI00194015FA|nr:hypothetical protein [Bacillus sp. B15-48]MBM4761864.1 hypothetical protein [Bacillus sp. B15-48]